MLIKRLLVDPTSADDVGRALAGFQWDSDRELAELGRADVIRALEGYLEGSWTADELTTWADMVEGREDIGREAGLELWLNDVIHFLANPDTEGPLTIAEARSWLEKLRV